MMSITVKFLGGLRQDMGMAHCTLWLPDGATVADLEPRLRALGVDLDAEKNIAVLSQRGLDQWPPDRQLISDEVVIIFPHIAGGGRPRLVGPGHAARGAAPSLRCAERKRPPRKRGSRPSGLDARLRGHDETPIKRETAG